MHLPLDQTLRLAITTALLMWQSSTMVMADVSESEKVKYTIIAGYDYSSGDYGQSTDSSTITLPLTLKAESRNWIAKLQMSRVRFKEEIPEAPNASTMTSTQTHRGPGDSVVYLARKTYFYWKGHNFLDAGIKVKIPTASVERRLGTGETDWMLQLDGFRSYGHWLPFVTAGYRWRGDSEDFDRDNGWFGSLGIHRSSPHRWSAGMILDYRTASTNRLEDGQEWIPYWGYQWSRRLSFLVYGVLGLSDASADKGLGVQIVFK